MFKRTTLKNGLKLITWPGRQSGAVTVLIMFKVGSRYEANSVRGISHFIEHMMFMGTKKRPDPLDVAAEMDGLGAEFNAFTSKDFTGYYIKAARKHLPVIMNLLADILVDSIFGAKQIEKERGVITEELKMYEDNPMMHISDLFEETMYGRSSLGEQIIGNRRTLRKISRANIVNYFKRFYQPANMTVVAAGSFNPAQFNLRARRAFGNLPRRKKIAFEKVNENLTAREVKVSTRPVGQVQLALGVPAYPYDHPKLYPLGLLSIILGEGMSSRLFTEIRNKRGLAYAVRSHIQPYEDTGFWAVQAGVIPAKLEQSVKIILKEMDRLRQEPVKDSELKKAKENIKGRLVLNLEDSFEQAQWLAMQDLFHKKLENTETKFRKIDRVKAADIQKVARDIFTADSLNLALVGPVKGGARFKKLLNF